MERPRRGEQARLIGALRRDRAALLVTTALTAAVVSLLAVPAQAQLAPNTQPTGGVVVAGSARIGAAAATTTVTQSSQRAAVNWQTFNVGSAATVEFVQPSANAVTLNRVTAPDPSLIAGHIHANGGIVITNQSGVVFAQGSEVNAASVLVSAPGITNRNFMAGRMQFDIPPKPGARIVNAGRITVKSAGLAALVAPEVANSGVITAKLGHVILAGGAAAETLDLYGDGLVSLDVTPEAHAVRLANGARATALVTNTGTIIASGGIIELTAQQADGLVQNLVDAGGTIAANSVGAHTGTIAITGIGGSIRIPGTLLAEGRAPGTSGGAIVLDATGTVSLPGSARVDASGAAGGGTVAIGTTLARARGGPGTAATLTANDVSIAPHARIAASATDDGDGGHVTVLSLDTTIMQGVIRARGGRLGGNGGSVEISGENLTLDGRVDTGAPLGATGSILLDPYDLTIVASGGTSDTDVTSAGVAFSAGGTAAGDTDTVNASAIEALTGTVTLQAIHDLEIAGSLTLNGTNQSLTLQAGNDLMIDAGVLVSATGNIEMDAASSAITGHTSTGAITVNGTVSAGGSLTLSAGTNGITINGSIDGSGLSLTSGGLIAVAGTATSISPPGNLSLDAQAGSITISGSIGGDAVTLMATGGASDSGGAIRATTLTGTVDNGATLTGVNNIGTLGDFTALSGGFSLTDQEDLAIAGKVNAGADDVTFTINSGGTLIESNGTIVAGTLTGSSAGSVSFDGNNTISSLGSFTVSSGTFSLTNQQALGITGTVSAAGNDVILTINDGGNLAEQTGGEIIAGTLSGSSAGSTNLGEPNTISSLGNFTVSSGTFSLTDQQPLGITGAVSAAGNDVNLTINDGGNLAEQTGGTIIAGTLSGSAGSANLGEPNTISSLGNFTVSSGAFSLTNAAPLGITGKVSAVDNGVTLAITQGNLAEQAGGTIIAGTLSGSATEGVELSNLNTIDTLGAFSSGGNFSLVEGAGHTLVVNGTVSVPSTDTISLTADGIVLENTLLTGALTSPDGTVALAPESALPIALLQTGTASGSTLSLNDGELNLIEASALRIGSTSAGSITISGSFALPTGIALLDLLSNGAVVETSADSLTVGTLEANLGAGASLIGTLNEIGTLGAFTAPDGLNLTDHEVLAIAGMVNVGSGNVGFTINNGGSLTEATSGGITATTGTLTGSAASVTLASLNNSIDTLGDFTAPGGFTLTDQQALSIAGALNASAGAASLTINGGGLSEAGAGAINAATLTGSAASVVLNGTNALGEPVNTIGTLGNYVVSGSTFSLTEAPGQALLVNGTVSLMSTGTISLAADGLTIGWLPEFTPGSLVASGGTVLLTSATPGLSLDVTTGAVSASAGTISLGSPSGIAGVTAQTLVIGASGGGPITVTGPVIELVGEVPVLDLLSGGTVSDTSGGLAVGTLGASVASANLDGSNAIGTLDDITALGGFTLDSGGNLALVGSLDIGNSSASLTISNGSINGSTGTISAGALAAIASGGSIVLTGTNQIATLNAIEAGGGFTLTNGGSLIIAGAVSAIGSEVSLSVNGGLSESTGSIAAGTLTGSAGSAALNGTNDIGTLNVFTVLSGFSLTNDEVLAIAGMVNVGSGNAGFTINNGGSLTEASSGGIAATTGSLTGSAASVTLGSPNNSIDTLGDFVALGGFTLSDQQALSIAGALNASAGAASLTINGGGLSEAVGGAINAATLTGSAASVVLNGTNALGEPVNTIGTLGNYVVSGSTFSLTEAPGQALLVNGTVSLMSTGTISLAADGLTIGWLPEFTPGSLVASDGTVLLTSATPGLSLDVTTGAVSASSGTISLGSPSGIAGVTAQTLVIGASGGGPITVTGPVIDLVGEVQVLDLLSGGTVSDTSGGLAVGTLAASVASANLDGSNAIGTLDDITALGGFTLDSTENLTLAGSLEVNNNSAASLTISNGSIGESAGTITAGTLAASASGSIVLTDDNSIGALGDVTAPGGFTLDNPAGFLIAGSVNAGSATVLLSSTGAVQEDGGSITAGVLSGTFASATLGGANDITDLGPLAARGGFSLTNDETLTISGPADVDHATASFAINGGSLLEAGAGVLSAGLIEGSAAGVSLPNGANTIGTLGAFSAPGGLQLAVANALAISGVVDSGTSAVDLTVGGSIGEIAGGTLMAGELLGFAGGGTLTGTKGTADFTNTNTVTSLGNFTALGGFSLADTGSLALLGALDGGTANVALTGGAAVSEPTGSINATTLSGSLASATLGGANTIPELANFTATGGFSLTDLVALTLTGPVSAGNAEAAFAVGGTIAENNAGILTAGTLTGSATLIDFANAANAISSLGAITTSSSLTLTTASGLAIAGSVNSSSAPIVLTAQGAITEIAGGTLIAGALSGSASAASFANPNTIAELGSFTALGGFTLDNAADLPLAGPLDAGQGSALLIAGGLLFETKATLLGETTVGLITAGTLTGSAGSVTLGNTANQIVNLGSFTAGAFNLSDGENLTVIGTVAGDPIGLVVNGDLTLGSGAGQAVLSSAGPVFLTASGAITEPAGAIEAASLSGSAASASLGGANLVPVLDGFTTKGLFLLNAAEPVLTVNGPLSAGSASLASAGSLVLAGLVSSGSAILSAGGPITEQGGLIQAGTLAGVATSATLTATNTIDTLGSFSTPGTFLLTDAAPLSVVGPVTAAFLGISDPAAISFTGSTDVGTLSVTSGTSITEPSGVVIAGLLEGSASSLAQFGPDAPAGSATVTTLGPFSVTAGTFTLTDSAPLIIIGPLDAEYFAITAPGSIVLENTSITTLGLPVASQSGATPSRPGSFFDVTTPGGSFLQLGRATIDPTAGSATVRIQLDPAGGLIKFADLVAPTTTLILDTGAGSAVGTIDLGALIVIGDQGSASLTGTVANLSGIVASSKATISPFQSPRYRLNSCPLMSVNCIFIAPLGVPQGNPLEGLDIVSAAPPRNEIDLLLPNVAAQDY